MNTLQQTKQPTMTLLDHAIKYAAKGWEVFPLKPDKAPYVSQYHASSAAEQVKGWWQRWPDALIGCRVSADAIVLDIDPRHGGDATWRALQDSHGGIPEGRSHRSGRGDGGCHIWFCRPAGLDRVTSGNLDAWAREHGVGEQPKEHTGKPLPRWTSGIDIIQHGHRYTILPPSLHLATGQPYEWLTGPDAEPADMPFWLADLVRAPDVPAWVPAERPLISVGDEASPADWFCSTRTWVDVLGPHGWTIYQGDGEEGTMWRHPAATNPFSATIKYDKLFVHSTSTVFEPTTPSDPHGYTKFRALALLEHDGDLQGAARACIEMGAPSSSYDPRVGSALLDELVKVKASEQALVEPLSRPARFQVTSLSELFAMSGEFRWLIKGLWVAGSYGQLAGPMKSLKSYLAMAMTIGVASGLPVLDYFDVPAAGPVLYYVGEGGMLPWRRRLDRLCRSVSIDDPKGLPIHPVFDAGPVMDPDFTAALSNHLKNIQPTLVIIDPLYAYHGRDVVASNVHDEGALLTTISQPCVDAGSSLVVVNHFKKGSEGLSLSNITMAGGGEHSDSWVLVGHRDDPDVQRGLFRLRADIGSRQWGGRSINVDIDLGAFDDDTGEHLENPTWKIYPADGVYQGKPRSEALNKAKHVIVEALQDSKEAGLTKTALYDFVRGNRATFDKAFTALVGTEHITACKGGANGRSIMIRLGPSYYKTLGQEGQSFKGETTRPDLTAPDQLQLVS